MAFGQSWSVGLIILGEVQLIFISSTSVELTRTIASLTEKFPEIKTIALNINRKKSSEIYGDETEILWGERAILEGVLDYTLNSARVPFINSILK